MTSLGLGDLSSPNVLRISLYGAKLNPLLFYWDDYVESWLFLKFTYVIFPVDISYSLSITLDDWSAGS
jgi:hypothetical protein